MMNEIVSYALEIIFGLFLVSVLAKSLLGIDVLGGILRLYNKLVYGIDIEKSEGDSEDDE